MNFISSAIVIVHIIHLHSGANCAPPGDAGNDEAHNEDNKVLDVLKEYSEYNGTYTPGSFLREYMKSFKIDPRHTEVVKNIHETIQINAIRYGVLQNEWFFFQLDPDLKTNVMKNEILVDARRIEVCWRFNHNAIA